MQFKHKLKLLLNDPSFKRIRIDSSKSQQPKQILFRNVFPSKLQIQRFRHLEQARVNTSQDMQLSKNVDHSILKMQQALKIFSKKDLELQTKRDSFFGKFKMDYVESEMNQNLDDLQNLVKKHENLHKQIKEERGLIEKSLKMTEIKRALKIQNELLKKENEKLKQQEKKLDNYLASTAKNQKVRNIQTNQQNKKQIKKAFRDQKFINNTMISDIINIHKNFIVKPNPYVTQQQAEEAYTKFAVGEFMMISSVGFLSMSLLKLLPRLSQRAYFKKFTVFQAFTGVVAYGWYFYEINQIGKTIPKEQLERQKAIAKELNSKK